MIVKQPDATAVGIQAVVGRLQRQIEPLGRRYPDDIARDALGRGGRLPVTMRDCDVVAMRVQGDPAAATVRDT